MKRPPGIWLLLSAGVLWLNLQDVSGIRATELIFGKSTSTTTSAAVEEDVQDEGGVTEAVNDTNTNTTSNLTGIPQIDYIWDPNLPKELNGYNLSSYPFYERVPEDIDFKCDGLHDGFYASVPHKCQVYHHCLFGTRYDFLCANYTAFDQKTFICHFVSEVDCVNSKKYWHRNDALYKAASTTTQRPTIIYTPPPAPQQSPAAAAPSAPGGGAGVARRPAGRRRPLRRRRPQYDYYDYEYDEEDYYEERRPARTRKRPRPRPRPVYEDEEYEEEYEDERYERRPNRNRRPEPRPDRRRTKDKDRRRYEDEEEQEYEEERRYHKRRPAEEEEDRRSKKPSRRPHEDDSREEPEKAKRNRRPIVDEEESVEEEPKEDKPLIKPISGTSIYDRPRAAPRIKPPVPKNEANKYAYKPVSKAPPVEEEEEYEDEYEDEVPVKTQRRPPSGKKKEEERDTRKHSSTRLRAEASREDSYEDDPPRRLNKRPSYRERTRTNKKTPIDEEHEDKEPLRTVKTTTTTTTTTPKPTTTTTKEPLRPDSVVRIVKRPFLPSRGGSPYSRGLQPVGLKAAENTRSEEETEPDETMEVKPATIKMNQRQKYVAEEELKPPPRPTAPSVTGPRTTQKPKLPESDLLDIPEDEYDVTLNDALNPTLPNLPVRGYPAGFSSGSEYNQRPRFVQEAVPNVNYYKPVRQRFEAVPYNPPPPPPPPQFVNTETEYKGQYSRPRVTQAYFTRF